MNPEAVEIKISEKIRIEKTIEKIIKERIIPRIWQWAYLGLSPILRCLEDFSHRIKEEGAKSILDLGCGVKPYRILFPFVDDFIGLDVEKNERVDVVGLNWNLPFDDGKFDAVIATQSLEHTEKIFESVSEIRRVVKKNGLVFISIPFVFPEHGIPHDYYRFTRYGLAYLFKDFEIIRIIPLNGYINTLARSLNVLLHYLPGSDYYLFPIFFINNLLAIFFDKLALLIANLGPSSLQELYEKYYMGFTADYAIILRNSKKKT